MSGPLGIPAPRVAALTLLALLLGLVGLAIYWPWTLLEQQTARQAALDERILALRLRATSRDALLEQQRQLEALLQSNADLLESATPALAAAELQGAAKSLVEASGAAVDTAQILPVESDPPFARIGLQLTFATDMAGLRRFLHEVETHRPLMLVTALTISDPTGGDPSAEVPPRSLETMIELQGFIRQHPG